MSHYSLKGEASKDYLTMLHYALCEGETSTGHHTLYRNEADKKLAHDVTLYTEQR